MAKQLDKERFSTASEIEGLRKQVAVLAGVRQEVENGATMLRRAEEQAAAIETDLREDILAAEREKEEVSTSKSQLTAFLIIIAR